MGRCRKGRRRRAGGPERLGSEERPRCRVQWIYIDRLPDIARSRSIRAVLRSDILALPHHDTNRASGQGREPCSTGKSQPQAPVRQPYIDPLSAIGPRIQGE